MPAAVLDNSTTAETSAGRSARAPSDPPAIGATTDKSVSETAHEEVAASIPAASAPPARMPSEPSHQAIVPPAIPPPAVTSAALGKAQDSTAAPTNAPAPVSDHAKQTAQGGKPTTSSGTLIMCSLILVFGLALVGVMGRVTKKHAAEPKDQIFPDDSWYNPYEDPEFCRQLRQGALHADWERSQRAINNTSVSDAP